MTELELIIRNEIAKKGPITFAKFMDIALYYPKLGYYMSDSKIFGSEGDYFTSSDVHPLFGAMLADQFVEMWKLLGCPEPWVLVECGAGRGRLAGHVLERLEINYPDVFKMMVCWIVEVSEPLVNNQKKELSKYVLGDKIRWAATVSETAVDGAISGCIFSNELIDAFPVHRVRQTSKGLREIYVGVDGREGKLTDVEGPLSSPELKNYVEESGVALTEGQTMEVNLSAGRFIRELSQVVGKGFVVTVDYGLEAYELADETRFDGTLRCFFKHVLVDDPYKNIGMQDITAHVDFTALKRWGNEAGLTNAGLTTQAKFLINMGILDNIRPEKEYMFDEKNWRDISAVKMLVMPGGMGEVFKVLIQCKGFDGVPALKGMASSFGIKKRGLY